MSGQINTQIYRCPDRQIHIYTYVRTDKYTDLHMSGQAHTYINKYTDIRTDICIDKQITDVYMDN
jgi:hypothetical protein